MDEILTDAEFDELSPWIGSFNVPRVERILRAKMAQAWDEGEWAGEANVSTSAVIRNPYKEA